MARTVAAIRSQLRAQTLKKLSRRWRPRWRRNVLKAGNVAMAVAQRPPSPACGRVWKARIMPPSSWEARLLTRIQEVMESDLLVKRLPKWNATHGQAWLDELEEFGTTGCAAFDERLRHWQARDWYRRLGK